jgi:hypothetical protein
MRLGLSYNTGVVGTDPASLKAIARHADDLGFESFYVPEHVTLYPGARVGEIEFAPDLPIADPVECLSFVAARPRRSARQPPGRGRRDRSRLRDPGPPRRRGDRRPARSLGGRRQRHELRRRVLLVRERDQLSKAAADAADPRRRQLEAFATLHGLRR